MLGVKRWPIQSAVICTIDDNILQDLVAGSDAATTTIYLRYRGLSCILLFTWRLMILMYLLLTDMIFLKK